MDEFPQLKEFVVIYIVTVKLSVSEDTDKPYGKVRVLN